jgi:hypothetical protein
MFDHDNQPVEPLILIMVVSDCTSDMPTPASCRPLHSNERPGAIRMARLRERRLRGFRCFVIEVSQADVGRLVARGFLDRLQRDDPDAIERSIGAVLDRL